ncbi:hypothetical protein IF090_11735 [Acinetobacter towneri]|uniref:hypothetical protein n=1 Tax=Acinetobacter towneri TaxID=202956 RepID=UPI001CE0AD8D|nr:hypothetical protein [Acinetobacter towneri]MCA4780295.1 hypothetical protein [Acinetobacter towneri]MCA4785647.1 hypothetical protein [Acinetobacter towneri]MCA4787519.1 hypothetical protein [Acinetobacter towneri]MCA4796801.1 hypothetical protein [Acinetobacter towneri]MCA4801848.1 hypothetical protein [Acinetobacter towneri]
MGIDEIRKNAPEGATHYSVDSNQTDYIKHEHGNWYVWYKDNWEKLHPIVFNAYRSALKPL